jgi:hypothetical protein
MIRVVSRDLGRYGVTVNGIAPSADTRMTQSVPDSAREARAARGIAGASLARRPTAPPEQIAPMVAYLCSDDAWNINGQIFAVGGGNVSLLYHPFPPFRTIFKEEQWTLDDLRRQVPQQLMAGVENPAPPAETQGGAASST